MTLPELLIAITVLGIVIAVLSSAVIVTARQQRGTEGRLNVARAEQAIGMWMPADLASADTVDDAPTASACPGEATFDGPCPGMHLGPGSNALLITWSTLVDDDPATGDRTYDYTYVSYYYSQDGDGTYKLTRIECTKRVMGADPTGPGWACGAIPVVTELTPPHAAWLPGDPVPEDVIAVTIPLDAGATDESQVVEPGQNNKNARRVIVTVNGGGSSEGAGGGRNTISITAGGTNRTEIDASSMQGAPTFVEARSKCGGPLTLVIDESSSIGSTNIVEVRRSVREFIKVLAGTPVRVQLVTFSDRSRTLGTTDWTKYYDLTNQDDIVALVGNAPHNSGGLVDQISLGGGGQTGSGSGSSASGYTNWEDALFRSFRTTDGLVPQTIPKTLVFFTDGMPTRDRSSVTTDGRVYRSDTQAELSPVTPPGWGPAYTGTDFSQVGFNRANYWANQARGSVQRMVGVFVGSTTATSAWITNPGAGYHIVGTGEWAYESNRDFQSRIVFQSRIDYESQVNFQRRTSGNNWTNVQPTEYYDNNTTSDSTDGWRINGTRTYYDITPTEYYTWGDADGQVGGSSLTGWRINSTRSYYTVTPTEYFTWGVTPVGSPTGTARSNWRTNGTTSYYSVTPTEYYTWGVTPAGSASGSPRSNWRIGNSSNNGTRAWYEVTAAEYTAYSSVAPGNWTANEHTEIVYGGTAPFDGYDDPASPISMKNIDILGSLIAPGGAVQAQWDTSTNDWDDLDADLYATTDWSRLAPALKAIALGECGGTLTLQTRRGTSSVSDPFVYQNSNQWDASGNLLSITPNTVTTNLQFTTGTFDFEIASGLYRVAEIVPHNMSSLGAYSHVGWECKAGVRTLTQGPLTVASNGYEVFNVPGSSWTGIRVKVGANEAVSCTQTVTSG